jgi:adenine deaminase
MSSFSCSGMVVDVVSRKIFPGTIAVAQGKITSITSINQLDEGAPYILPGFIDAHVHIESSMLIPSEFARLASVHGTVATVSDPHEIANVLGIEGVRYMINNGKTVPFHFYFGASSCVPATVFETAGAVLSAADIEELFRVDGLKYLSEMMNYPGVLNADPMVMEKLTVAKKWARPIDGHAPGLRGMDATRYIQAGISTDHECFTFEEGFEKAQQEMHILIRQGSAAKNYDALHPLIKLFPHLVMFCSDDKHPDALVKGHINELVKRSIIDEGYDLMDVLRAASYNPIKHYGLDVGLLQTNDPADFIVIDNLQDFNVLETYFKGECIARNGKTLIQSVVATTPNHFNVKPKRTEEFAVVVRDPEAHIHVIHPEDGQIITKNQLVKPTIIDGAYVADPKRGLLKLTVINRYTDCSPAVAFIDNFGLKRGAIASCVAHDSHNIIAVGCTDEEIKEAVNLLIAQQGGIAVVDGQEKYGLPLPVAGIMSHEEGYAVAQKYAEIDSRAKELGSTLQAPFMTLSFMALLVIPALKLSDKGLFDGNTFSFVSLEART